VNFLRSRAELLADELRLRIARGELVEPLPDTRTWSERLGVSRTNLEAALGILKREGLVSIRPRKGVRLVRRRATRIDAEPGPPKLVRFLYYGRDFPDLPYTLFWLGSLMEHLSAQGVHVSLERCSDKRLREISRIQQQRTKRPRELLLLFSLSESHQRLFLGLKNSALALGIPARGVPLSYVGSDLSGAVRHATQTMLRRGFNIISFVLPRVSTASHQIAENAFQAACVEWPHQPVQREVVRLPLPLDLLVPAVRRFATRIKARQAIVALYPIPPATILSALLGNGVSVPNQVQLAVVLGSPNAVKLCPVPIHYPYPAEGLVKAVTNAAMHFFESGTLPRIRKVVPVQMVAGT
jgi:DNA-binding LacI/PurR family transcriptional regulator